MIRLQDVVTARAGALSEEQNGQQVVVAGMVQRARRHMTKKNEEMAFVTLEDLHGTCDVVVFPRVWSKTKHLWQPEQILVVTGKVDAGRRDTPSLLCNWAKTPDEVAVPVEQAPRLGSGQAPRPGSGQARPATAAAPPPPPPPPPRPPSQTHTVRVTLTRSGKQAQDVQTLRKIHSLLTDNPGPDRFTIRLIGGLTKPVELAFPNETTHFSPELVQQLTAMLGPNSIQLDSAAQA
jgi:hypothetical protein